MPELPDVTIYCEALERVAGGTMLISARALSLFVLRSVEPPISALVGERLVGVSRMGKRIVLSFSGGLHLVIHLMIAGRLLWSVGSPKSPRPYGKAGLAVLQFEPGHLVLTEVSSHKRASIVVVRDLSALAAGGLEVLDCSVGEFAAVLRIGNHTLKRSLTSPRFFSGIGNSYSDEILHAARLSPLKLTQSLSDEEVSRLFKACRSTLKKWTEKLRTELGERFPGRGEVTAFRPDFAAHGKFGKPCPVCGMPIQRIQYAENETNYCAKCQNEGRVLADRSLSRLLKDDWPRTIEEMVGEG